MEAVGSFKNVDGHFSCNENLCSVMKRKLTMGLKNEDL